MKGSIKLVADFETTTIENDCRVWGACACNINDLCIEFLSNNIDDFMDFIKENCPNSKVNFMDYPDEYHSILILNNGNLQCLDENKNFEPLSINPYGKIIYA